jgi:outer membrane protein OmpA-like peptidoglycan-associated protein
MRHLRSTLAPLTVPLAAFAMQRPALAAPPDTDFVVEQFEPLPGQHTNTLNIARSAVVPHLRPTIGLTLHFQDDPLQLVVKNDPDNIRQRIIDDVFKGELWASVGLFDFMDLGFAMPVILNQQAGQLITEGGRDFSALTTGDARIVPKFRLVDTEATGGFGLALLATLHLPTGDAGSYNSEGLVRIEPRLVADFAHDGVAVSANVAYQPRNQRDMLNFENDDVLRWGLGVELPLVASQLDFIASVFGTFPVGSDLSVSQARSMPVEALGGFKVTIAEDFVFQAAGGGGLSSGVGSPDFRVVGSFGFNPRPPAEVALEGDRDGDGLLDDVDACPDEPEDLDGHEDADGCPEADNDGDGVLDVADGAQDASGFGDCRDEAEDKDGFEDGDGCPDLDNDRDGILDTRDGAIDGAGFGACRDDAEDADGYQDQDGCPDPDDDADRVCDPWVTDSGASERWKASCVGRDECPREPETVNDYKDEDGCPDLRPRAVLTEKAITIFEKVFFDFNKDTIQARSFPLLDDVVQILVAHPRITRVRVEGHTDVVGRRKYNLDLSDRRAKAVMRYLAERGVAPERLEAVGYGPDRPIDPAATQEAHDKNRRVEFNIVESGGKPATSQEIEVE